MAVLSFKAYTWKNDLSISYPIVVSDHQVECIQGLALGKVFWNINFVRISAEAWGKVIDVIDGDRDDCLWRQTGSVIVDAFDDLYSEAVAVADLFTVGRALDDDGGLVADLIGDSRLQSEVALWIYAN